MAKFGRNYILEVQGTDGTHVFTLPFTLEFDITRNLANSSYMSTFRLYNLSKQHRNSLRFDWYNGGTFRAIKLNAGYGTNPPIVFDGNVQRAWSVREGVNWITTIETFPGGFAYLNGVTGQTVPKGSTQGDVMRSLMRDLPGIKAGKIGDYGSTVTTRGTPMNGATTELLNQQSGGGFFIDNNTAHCLQDNECIQGETPVINSASGLLGTPIRSASFLYFDMLFEPQLQVAQLIELDSITASDFNGLYKVNSLHHKGMISETACGNATTSVGLTTGLGRLVIIP